VIRWHHSRTCVYLQNAHLTEDSTAPLQSNQNLADCGCDSLGVGTCCRRLSVSIDGASRLRCGNQPPEGFQPITYCLVLANVYLGQQGVNMMLNWMGC
jgi:hypothetical protein